VPAPPFRPQLVGLDMDGTLCDSANAIPPENIAALRACRAAGIQLSILTGRRRSTLAPKLAELHAAVEPDGAAAWYVATNSGGLVWEYPGWRLLSAQTMPAELAAAIAVALAPHSLNVHINPQASGGLDMVHLRRSPSPAFDNYLARFGGTTPHVTAVEELLQHEVTLFALPAEYAAVQSAAARLRAAFAAEALTVLTMRWPLLDTWALEAYPPQLNKAAALAAIAQRLGLDRAGVAAAGDDVNDTSMLAWAARSAAMPHAPAEVAAAAGERLSGTGPAALAPWLWSLAAGAAAGQDALSAALPLP
jgi:Cof subfamily protein (haloacid dehalogenase superfamily)